MTDQDRAIALSALTQHERAAALAAMKEDARILNIES